MFPPDLSRRRNDWLLPSRLDAEGYLSCCIATNGVSRTGFSLAAFDFRQLHKKSKTDRLKPVLLKSVLSRIAVNGRMADIAARDHVDHIFGDVSGVVGDALQILGDQD